MPLDLGSAELHRGEMHQAASRRPWLVKGLMRDSIAAGSAKGGRAPCAHRQFDR